MSKIPIEPFRFKVSGNLIKRLGSESISNPIIAILELVKNTYDADAHKISIEFSNLGTDNSEIIIKDDGNGMSFEDIEYKWMVIASDHKRDTEKTDEGRVIVGEKGIGRMASESLGDVATLRTMKKDEKYGYEIVFNWKNYDRSSLCNEIKNDSFKFDKETQERGTEITIRKLKHKWDESKLKELLHDLELFNSVTKKIKNFEIKLNGEKVKFNNDMLNLCAYRLNATLKERNKICYRFFKGGKSIYKKEKSIQLDGNLLCGETELDLYFFYKNKESYKDWLKMKLTDENLISIKDFLDTFSGIKIYRDNFRVKPYGDKNNGYDWLDLEKKAQDQTIYPRLGQLFGQVLITKQNNKNIIDTTTREGIIFTDEFRDLISFVWISISKIFVDGRSRIESKKKKARKVETKKSKKVNIKKVISEKYIEENIISFKGMYPKINQVFYERLEDDINNCYTRNHPTSTFMMCRKLVENFVLDILKKKYHNNPELYINGDGMPLDLSVLIRNLFDKRSDMASAKQSIETFNQRVGNFRRDANNITHRVAEYLENKDDLKKYKIKELIQLLVCIYQTL